MEILGDRSDGGGGAV